MDGFLPTFTRRKQSPEDKKPGEFFGQVLRFDSVSKVLLPLQDLPDDAFEVYVKPGDVVRQGQAIGCTGLNPDHIKVHSSIAGNVTQVALCINSLGQTVQCVEIQGNGSNDKEPENPFDKSDNIDLFYFLREAGVQLDYKNLSNSCEIIINTTEFEPDFTTKWRLLIEKEEKCVEGLRLLLDSGTQKKTALFIVHRNNNVIKATVKRICSQLMGAVIKEVEKSVPDTAGILLRQAGNQSNKRVFVDIAQLTAVYDAYFKGEPLTQKLISVSGSAVETTSGDVWVKIGTSASDLISMLGGNVQNTGRLNIGGVLTGLSQSSMNVPVTKTTNGIYAAVAVHLDHDRKSRFYMTGVCVRCGKCMDVCPSGIVPNSISELVQHRMFVEAEEQGLFSCIECGLCAYVCPSIIPIADIIIMGKMKLKGIRGVLRYNNYMI